ncbi:MAG: asparagine synthase (glutamine-hydrolyzing) [Pseudomonadota bacterium]
MCGIAGYAATGAQPAPDASVIRRMLSQIVHRGPDSEGVFAQDGVALGFRRLALVDLAGGDQPLYNEDRSLVLCCNGEIFNHKELRRQLAEAGHSFATHSDVEVILHLYEEHGLELTRHLNGQFAFVLYDRKRNLLVLCRDHSGIAPMYYAVRDGGIVFGSEAKALLPHPAVRAEVDLVGLDQVVCFPGLVSPRTLFRGIEALAPGCLLTWSGGEVAVRQYWDLDYPRQQAPGSAAPSTPASARAHETRLAALFKASVQRRLQADAPVGVYLSGGLDSSMIACMAAQLSPEPISTFSVTFSDRGYTEESYQRLVAERIGARHHELRFEQHDLVEHMERMVRHAECPVKESYNTCSMLLSGLAREQGVKAILTGEGADELFAGYPSYKFAEMRAKRPPPVSAEEQGQRMRLWGTDVDYERDYSAFGGRRLKLYSERAREQLREHNALSTRLASPERLEGRDRVQQRSYLDCKLRLADHLLVEHGDRMLLANSVEGRYPFLDQELVDYARSIPSDLKLSGFHEKFILKRIAAAFTPMEIVRREKSGFHAPGSPWLLHLGGNYVRDLLSPARIRRQGYFDADVVAAMVDEYSRPDFALDARIDDDLLMIVLSFSIFLDVFGMGDL